MPVVLDGIAEQNEEEGDETDTWKISDSGFDLYNPLEEKLDLQRRSSSHLSGPSETTAVTEQTEVTIDLTKLRNVNHKESKLIWRMEVVMTENGEEQALVKPDEVPPGSGASPGLLETKQVSMASLASRGSGAAAKDGTGTNSMSPTCSPRTASPAANRKPAGRGRHKASGAKHPTKDVSLSAPEDLNDKDSTASFGDSSDDDAAFTTSIPARSALARASPRGNRRGSESTLQSAGGGNLSRRGSAGSVLDTAASRKMSPGASGEKVSRRTSAGPSGEKVSRRTSAGALGGGVSRRTSANALGVEADIPKTSAGAQGEGEVSRGTSASALGGEDVNLRSASASGFGEGVSRRTSAGRRGGFGRRGSAEGDGGGVSRRTSAGSSARFGGGLGSRRTSGGNLTAQATAQADTAGGGDVGAVSPRTSARGPRRASAEDLSALATSAGGGDGEIASPVSRRTSAPRYRPGRRRASGEDLSALVPSAGGGAVSPSSSSVRQDDGALASPKRAGGEKVCSLCNQPFTGYGDTCKTCRNTKKNDNVKECTKCGAFFVGFKNVCDECDAIH